MLSISAHCHLIWAWADKLVIAEAPAGLLLNLTHFEPGWSPERFDYVFLSWQFIISMDLAGFLFDFHIHLIDEEICKSKND